MSENKPLEQDERREHDRSRLIIDVFFDGQDTTGVASTKDISAGGLYINTQAHIPEGSSMMIRIPFAPDQQIICSAQVVYSNPGYGVGVRFVDLSDEARHIIEHELGHG